MRIIAIGYMGVGYSLCPSLVRACFCACSRRSMTRHNLQSSGVGSLGETIQSDFAYFLPLNVLPLDTKEISIYLW
jgi:hypothetical protein